MKTQAAKRDFSSGQNFIAPVLRKKQLSGAIEETISTTSNADSNGACPQSDPPMPATPLANLRNSRSLSIQEGPELQLYQDYSSGEPRV